MTWPRCTPWALLAVGLASGCSDGDPSDRADVSPHDAVAREDSAAPLDVAEDAQPAPDADPDAEAAPDGVDPADAEVAEPDTGARCGVGQACAGFPDDQGVCAGGCFAQPQTLSCAGTVVESLCLPPGARLPGTPDPAEQTLGPLHITLVEAPQRAVVGQAVTLKLTVDNTSASALSLPFGSTWKPNWSLADGNFLDWVSVELPAGGSVTITAAFEALRPDVFDLDGGWLITFYLGDAVLELHAGIAMRPEDVPAEQAVPCGDAVYPRSWCGDDLCTKALRFDTAACCDGVFFPGAECCADAACDGGACVDGACVDGVPQLAAANTLLHGTQRLLVVLADYPAFAGLDPCQDQSVALGETLGLGLVESWFRGHALARTGQDLVDFRWTVLAGLSTDEVVPTGSRTIPAYRDALATWLADRPGCPALADFDKVILAAAKADLQGVGGAYVDFGTLGVGSYTSPYLFAHELTHSFGATDLGQTLEGPYLYPDALMATHSAADASDQVAWGEIGWGDVDRSGVIDVFEVAAYPKDLSVSDLSVAVVGAPGAERLVITWRFTALEGGVRKRALLSRFRFELPELGLWWEAADARDLKRVEVPRDGLGWEALLAAGSLAVRLSGTLAFTDAAGERQTLTLDQTTDAPIETP